jgi:hypothetical protein
MVSSLGPLLLGPHVDTLLTPRDSAGSTAFQDQSTGFPPSTLPKQKQSPHGFSGDQTSWYKT